MAHSYPDNDCDSTFGEDIFSWNDPMFSPLSAPLAGSKRDADNVIKESHTTAPGLRGETEHQAEHIDPRDLCCSTCCPEQPPCPAVADGRPSKRRASAQKVGEFCSTAGEASNVNISNTDHQFLDVCYETFCQDYTPCDSPCALSCQDGGCSPEDACFDPHCDQGGECSDKCVDPECSKATCPDDPCFCQKCEAGPCPLGDPNSECHSAHTAPTATGTIYCYDSTSCHFNDGFHFGHGHLPPYESYPCFSPSHDTLGHGNGTAGPSSTTTSIFSPSNYTSIESAFSTQPSPAPGPSSATNCFLGNPYDHCHINKISCCHGSTRLCEEYPSQDNFDLWKLSLGQDNGLSHANGYTPMDFGLQPSHAPSSLSLDIPSSDAFDPTIPGNMLSFDNSWMLPESQFSTTFAGSDANKLDYLASAVQEDLMSRSSTENASTFSARPMTSASTDSSICVCRWQHGPSIFCLQIFDGPEALHKHIKAAHVDNCARCFCQWEGCDAGDKDFKQRSKLSRHLLAHAGYRPYACSFQGCNKTFATNQAKDNHERTHTGERPYVCSECGYTTTTHTQLQTHISALHLGQKPHKCRFCDFTCADSSNLSKHERTHQVRLPLTIHSNATKTQELT